MGAMEAFVDVTYRGLEVGRRIKLTEVSPASGYLEVAIPMPVGTTIEVAIADGVTIAAVVRGVHEQVSGSPRPPGMQIAPDLAADAARAWWSERVTISEAEVAQQRAARTSQMSIAETETVRAAAERDRKASGAPPVQSRKTRPMAEGEVKDVVAVAEAASVFHEIAGRGHALTPGDGVPTGRIDEDGIVDDGKKTEVMSAVDPELLARLTGSGEMPIVDDGKKTLVMDTATIEAAMAEDSGPTSADSSNGGDDEGEPAPSASGKMAAQGKRKRRRRR